MTQQRLQALNDGPTTDFWHERDPKCPHCGHVAEIEANELYRLYEEGEHQVDCPACDLEYTVTTDVSFSFSTDQQDDD